MDQTGGIGKRTQRVTAGRNFRTISELDVLKVQRYIRGNIELLQSEKRCVDFLKFLLKLGLKIYFEGIQRAY